MERLRVLFLARLAVSILGALAAGFVGSIFTSRSVSTWYATIAKPNFTPPSWLFGPVWTALYVLMGIAAFVVWNKGLQYDGVRVALVAYLAQLGLNAAWSFAFFGMRSPLAGLVVIAALWVAILFTILSFSRVSVPAAAMLVPYVAWVSFAAVLNASIFVLNRQ